MGKITDFNSLTTIAEDFRKSLLGDHRKEKDIILLFAHNGSGKTRLSMDFKDLGKTEDSRDTLYFNAFTEDLFIWNNDLENDIHRCLEFNKESAFFDGLHELEMDTKIEPFFNNYTNLHFDIDYEKARISFSRSVIIDDQEQTIENIKISRGKETLFRWSFFLAIYQLAIDQDEAYDWVKFVYIDDPISSLDENSAIAVGCDLAKLIIASKGLIKTIVSTHHSLFFNVMFNELKSKIKNKIYFLHATDSDSYRLQDTGSTPFFHHIAVLSELEQLIKSDDQIIYTFHFNALRSILEKTASFFGYDKIDQCIKELEEKDEILFKRALNIFSHGPYSIFNPAEMGKDSKDLFEEILIAFLSTYEFHLPEIFEEEIQQEEI